jgi:uncharacterized protein (DUF1499 family)
MSGGLILVGLACGLAGFVATMVALSLSARRPRNLGVRDGRLIPCPPTPNCVCSQCDDPVHAVPPFAVIGPPDAVWRYLRDVLAAHPRTRVVTATDDYLHAECSSLVFRFVDDVEFLRDDAGGVIHVRSAARVGRSDLGVNRRRVRDLRAKFEQG